MANGSNDRRLMISLLVAMALLAAACGGTAEGGDDTSNGTEASEGGEESVNISMAIIVDNLPVDENVRGFKTRMEEAGYVVGETIEYRERNAFGQIDKSELIARQSVDDNPDLIYVVGTPIVIALYQINEEIPTIFSLMTDPVGGGVVDSFESPGRNFTGTSDAVSGAVFMEALTTVVPDVQTVGILGNTSEQNTQSQIDEFTAEAEALGLEVEVAPVATTNDIVSAVRSLEGRVDALVVGADGTVISGSDTMIQAAKDAGLPLVMAGSEFAEDGALIGIGPDFFQLGVTSADIVIDILENGTDPRDIPVVDAVSGGGLAVSISSATADEIGLSIPDNLPDEYTVVTPEG